MAEVRNLFLQDARARGLRCTVTSEFRSIERQRALYAARASNPNPVAKPGKSAHNYGLAFDVIEASGRLDDVASLARSVGFGVIREPTCVHIEWPNWRSSVRLA